MNTDPSSLSQPSPLEHVPSVATGGVPMPDTSDPRYEYIRAYTPWADAPVCVTAGKGWEVLGVDLRWEPVDPNMAFCSAFTYRRLKPTPAPEAQGTPLTDAAVVEKILCTEGGDEECTVYPNSQHVEADFARQLERELAASQAARRDECWWWKEKRAYQERAETAERELAAERKRVGELEGALAKGQENCDAVYEDLRAERDEARAQLAAARLDTERLDWLEENCADVLRNSDGSGVVEVCVDTRSEDGGWNYNKTPRGNGKSVRAAIDSSKSGGGK